MGLKSDSELKNIIENKSKYTNEALQAVIWELEKRELISEEEIKLEENTIEPSKEIKTFNSDESAFDEFEKVVLYSKKTIQGFTIFFSTIFGAVLLMSNLKTMNKPKERTQVLVFGILYTVFIYAVLYYLTRGFLTSLILNLIGYGILSEFFWNKYLGKDISYKKKEITKPLLISLGITLILVFLMFLPVILDV